MEKQRMSLWNRAIALLLTIVMGFGMLPTAAHAAENKDTVAIAVTSGKEKIADAEIRYTVSVNDVEDPDAKDLEVKSDVDGIATIDMQRFAAQVGKDVVKIAYHVTAQGYEELTGEFEVKTMGEQFEAKLTESQIKDQVRLRISKTGEGEILIDGKKVEGDTVQVPKGKSVQVEINPQKGSYIKQLTISGKKISVNHNEGYSKNHSFKRNDDEIAVNFTAEYQVTAKAAEGGTIQVMLNGKDVANQPVDAGSTVTVTVKAADGFEIQSVKIAGKDETITDQKTFSKDVQVSSAIEVQAAFTDVQPPKMMSSVEHADDWAREKKFNLRVEDNSSEAVTFYVSGTQYANLKELEAAKLTPVQEYTATAEGEYYVYAVDKGQNFASQKLTVTKIDREIPKIIDVKYDKTGFFHNKDTVIVEASDAPSGVKRVTYFRKDAVPADPVKDAKYKGKNYQFEVNENGTYKIEVEDQAGNKAETEITITNLDNVKPTISELQVEKQWSSTSLDVKFKAQDDKKLVGVYWADKEYADRKDIEEKGQAIKPDNGWYHFSATQNISYYVYAIDEAGNIGRDSIRVEMIDTDAPVIRSVQKEPNTPWHNGGIRVTVQAEDGQKTGLQTGSGVASVVYSTSPTGYQDNKYQTAVLENGKYFFDIPDQEFNGNYYIWAVDGSKRVSEVKTLAVSIDKTAPKVGMEYVKDHNKGFVGEILKSTSFGMIFSDAVYITVKGSDNRADQDSGIVKYQYQLVPVGETLQDDSWHDVVTGEETKEIKLALKENEQFLGKVYVRAFDAAGNASAPVTDDKDTTIIKDNQSPEAPSVNLNGYSNNGQWTNKDVTVTLSGGMADSGVKVYQYRIDYENPKIQDTQWADMPDATGNQHQQTDPSASVRDKLVINSDVNATYYFRAVSNAEKPSDEISAKIRVQKTKPANAQAEVNGTQKNENWYVKEFPTVSITPPTPAESAPPITTYYLFWNSSDGQKEPSEQDKVVFDGQNLPTITENGIYRLKVWTEDEAGNQCQPEDVISREIKVDISEPTDLSITINGESVLERGNVVFNTFYGQPVTVKLDADAGISGMKALRYQKVSETSAYDEAGPWTEYDKDQGIVIEPNEKFIIYFQAEDRAGNTSVVHSKGIVVDDRAPSGHNQEQLTMELDQPNENGIYSHDVKVRLHVQEPRYRGSTESSEGFYSGLRRVTYRIYTTDTDAVEEGVLMDADRQQAGAVFDKNHLVSSWSGEVTVDAEIFNSNNVIVEVTAVDNAGNSRTTATEAGMIKIDVKAPEIFVRYDNNSPYSDGKYGADRVATITIRERNFSPDDVQLLITNAYGNIPEISGWTHTVGAGNGDGSTHTATIQYTADGDYTFAASCKDLAGHESTGPSYADGTQDPTAFTIDKTAPVVQVSYDNNNVANGRYFNAPRTATITVTDRNFDPNGVTITQTADRGGVIPEVNWSGDGLVHTATVAYTHDGDYTFDVTVADTAGNRSESADYGSSAAGTDFVIDTTYDRLIQFGGVEKGRAYGSREDVVPRVEIADINLDRYTVTLVGVQKDRIIDLTAQANERLQVGAERVSGVFDLFRQVQEMDGIYTLTIDAQDKAGNQSREEIRFTVNRFGSVYVYGPYLMDLIAGGGTYVQNVREDLVITEYNPDKLVAGSVKIDITVDGKPLDHVKFTATPEVNDAAAVGDSGWYQYKYTISKDNFTADGTYKISISSADATGNKPENGNYQDMGINFYVDSTPPEISGISGLEHGIVNAAEAEVRYTVFDTMGIKSVKVYVNGELVDEILDFAADPNNYEGSFLLRESSAPQDVRLVVEDAAGNLTDTAAEGFNSAYTFNQSVIVSTNLFVRWYANKGLFWGSIGGVAALIAAIVLFVVSKRKKKQEQTAE